MSDLTIDVELEGITSAYIEGPFDENKRILNENGFRIISLEENALLRIQKGRDAEVSKFGKYTRECFVYTPKDGVFLVRNSPVLDYPEAATNTHHCYNKEFYINNEQTERVLEDSVQVPYDLKSIPTNRLADEKVTAFAFGDLAKAYGEFLRDAGIKEMPIWLKNKEYVPRQKKPFVRQLWFDSLDYGSVLGGCIRGLGYRGVRGIRGDIRGVTKTLNTKKEKPKYINPWEIEIPEIEK